MSENEFSQIKQILVNLEKQVGLLQKQIEMIKKFSLDTREIAVFSNETLPVLTAQYKEFILKEQAFIRELQDLGIVSAKRLYDYEHAMRQATRSTEIANLYRSAVDNLLKKVKSQQDELSELRNKLQKAEAELEAKDKYMLTLKEIPKIILELSQRGEIPSEVLAQLKEYLPSLSESTEGVSE